MLNDFELTGRTRTHVVQLDDLRCALHRDVVDPFLALRAAAAREGIDLRVFSAFRDFAAQLSIWNRKFSGQRPLFTRDGGVLEHAALGIDELLEAILNWSALPGASRHHWGSDIDVFDAAAVAPDYRVQLLPGRVRGRRAVHAAGPLARGARRAVRVFPALRPRPWRRAPGALAHQPCRDLPAGARSPDPRAHRRGAAAGRGPWSRGGPRAPRGHLSALRGQRRPPRIRLGSCEAIPSKQALALATCARGSGTALWQAKCLTECQGLRSANGYECVGAASERRRRRRRFRPQRDLRRLRRAGPRSGRPGRHARYPSSSTGPISTPTCPPKNRWKTTSTWRRRAGSTRARPCPRSRGCWRT